MMAMDVQRMDNGRALLPISDARWAIWRPASGRAVVVEVYTSGVSVNGYNLSPGDALDIDARDDQISRWV